MIAALISTLLPLLLAAGPSARPAVAYFEVTAGGPRVVGLASDAVREELASLELTWVSNRDLRDWLEKRDRQQGLLAEAGKLLKRGRKLHLGLKLRQAEDLYRQAVDRLEQGFALYYQPALLAEPLLQLGVAQFQGGRQDEAHKTFMRVAALEPSLQLAEGYYSPSVRKAFHKAQQDLGSLDPGVPPPAELTRICQAARVLGLLVITRERLGQSPVIRLSLFDARRGQFVAVETAVLSESDARAAGRDLGRRIRPALAGMAGLELPPIASVDGGVPDGAAEADIDLAGGDADESPWYARHWWIWPLAAGVAAAAVALPLTVFREDVVDVRVRY